MSEKNPMNGICKTKFWYSRCKLMNKRNLQNYVKTKYKKTEHVVSYSEQIGDHISHQSGRKLMCKLNVTCVAWVLKYIDFQNIYTIKIQLL